MPFVLTERLNQDCLEEHFGKHRALGRRNDNPDLKQFGYQSNTLRIKRSVAPVTGNTKRGHKKRDMCHGLKCMMTLCQSNQGLQNR